MREIIQNGAGIGLRAEHITTLLQQPRRKDIDFLELAPDNWMNIGGAKKEQLTDIASKYSLIAHSLSLSIGDICPLNEDYINDIRRFLDEYNIDVYSDHLCFSRDQQGYLYDLLPVPGFPDTLPYLAERIDRVQNLLGRQLVLENVSSYHRYEGEMPEAEFWCELLHRSGCGMLLDINNVYVNAFNHGFDALAYIRSIPTDSIVYYHIAGHLEFEEFRLDTHGMPVLDEVLKLAKETFRIHGARPLLLERDNNVPPLNELCAELAEIKTYILQ
ncbi:DUF692 domain-containing protein (plasmid) [Klebsiella pneumoniae]|uniref:DUF692 domain-containing protein n=1 Tax=Salmonella enterica TaxID=28901 RepID=A0A743JYF7_SALER|nr:DUF692 domain-containing protein [Klebsiella pneumoniae]HAF1690108.1 DUF692 domain-containing protein [Salmonella enterica]HBV9912673.1 DUF692 domain-containing protein [Klebsiella aerogenes]MBS8179450.1 DUF692 domain-containing protein [Klebsiella pneumoniae]MBT1552498.1 DUF692 domain-containing protein [Klebsiella pneumoniae]MBT1663605.1 DUF692 domain-containing protein [Klebsiella pneumoniae]